MRLKKRYRNGLFLLSMLPAVGFAASDVWLLIDTQTRNLEVKKGDQTVEVLEHVVIGRRGAGHKQHRGDDITPLGNYRIGWINETSQFRRFFGLTYPSTEQAKQALTNGQIDENTFERINSAHLTGSVPPQNTPLGGQIGIHGLGAGSLKIHQNFDWTHGCIALTNQQIDRLSQWVEKGTLVTVK